VILGLVLVLSGEFFGGQVLANAVLHTIAFFHSERQGVEGLFPLGLGFDIHTLNNAFVFAHEQFVVGAFHLRLLHHLLELVGEFATELVHVLLDVLLLLRPTEGSEELVGPHRFLDAFLQIVEDPLDAEGDTLVEFKLLLSQSSARLVIDFFLVDLLDSRHLIDRIPEGSDKEQSLNQAVDITGRSFVDKTLELWID